MGLLNIFTLGELVAVTMVVLQLILVTVMLRDKRLWRIHQNSTHASAARGRLEGQSNVDRAQRSAEMELPHGSSPRGSMSSRRRFPRFIRSCQDSQVLFEEHRKELEAQVPQWLTMQRGCRAAQPEVPVEPRLLGGKESPQGPREKRPKAGTDSAAKRDKAKAKRRGSGSALEPEHGSSCTAMAWFIPRDVQIAEAVGTEGSSSSSSSSLGLAFSIQSADPWWGPALPPAPRPLPLPAGWGRELGRELGRALGKLHARLGGCLAAWCSHRLPPCCCRRR
ncbi:uncharacterized protein LOC128822445 [Vidua macroura]|uniref:uncharacterized protein LOC128822445 n=1 Tax=Vidua macroura TaxID=187451 RepID=UPI0023A8E635|nr:uncharacterized protein LOC128822445 [Vidua macroura]